MRHFAGLLLLFAVGIALPACAQKGRFHRAKPQHAAAAPPIKASHEAGPVLTFQRTPCYGTCPSYTMQVFADGRVAYEGQRFVPLTGQKEFRLPPATVQEMLRKTQEARFDQLLPRYAQNTADLPSTVVAVRQPNGQLKTVSVEEGEPENVRALLVYLGNILDPLAGLRTTSDK